MKKTVWDIDCDATELIYEHESEEIFIRQDSRHAYGGKLHEIALAPEDADRLFLALSELKVILDAEKFEKALGEVA